MARSSTTKADDLSAKSDVSTGREGGFTYVEMLTSLFIFLLLLGPILLWYEVIRSEGEKRTEQMKILDDLSYIEEYLENEVNGATAIHVLPSSLDLASNEGNIIRYYEKNNKLIRTVRKHGESSFRGTTILSDKVDSFQPVKKQEGVFLRLGMKKNRDTKAMEYHLFFRQRGSYR